MSKKSKAAQSENGGVSVINDKNRSKVALASLRPLSTGKGPVAVKAPLKNVQLTPVVQPVALVPYSTQAEPLFTYEEEIIKDSFNNESYCSATKKYEKIDACKKLKCKRRNKIFPLLVMLVSILALFLMISGDYFLEEYLSLSNNQGITNITLGFLDSIAQNSFSLINDIAELSVLITFALLIIITFTSLFNIKRGVGIISKIISFFIVVFSFTSAIIFLRQEIINYGSYVLSALAFLILTLGYAGTRPCKCEKI